MKSFLAGARGISLRYMVNRALLKLRGGVVTLRPKGAPRGRVLLSYTTLPFTAGEQVFRGHSNRWECRRMAEGFLKRGYIVDVIDLENRSFKPRHRYAYCVDIDSNLERLAPLLNPDCTLVFHATAAHWLFWNKVEYERLADIQKRRGATIVPKRQARPTKSPDIAHAISSLCGPFPESTYHFLDKEIYPIPVTATHGFPDLEKDFASIKKRFIWFGGAGVVRKGLDIALEAFAGMPEYTLVVCGKYNEPDFMEAYAKELGDTPNIKTAGYMDTTTEEFSSLIRDSLAIVYPSSAEGCATSVLLTMQGGVIPIVSKETGVGTGDFGIMLEENSVESLQSAVRRLAAESEQRLRERSEKTREYARTRHSQEAFSRAYESFLDMLERRHGTH
jgi:glycosyltransferase involved in cell wall biosynthesis